MGVYSVTEVNFLRLLKSCERVLLKGDGDLPTQELHRYQQYVRTLHTYSEELQKRGADAAAADGDGDGDGDGAPCALPPEVMEQHQQKLELIEAALKRSLEAVQGADGGGPEGRTDRAALTTVRRKSTVRKDNAPAPPRISSSGGGGGGGGGSSSSAAAAGASGSGTARQSTPTRMRHRRANARAATAAAAPEPAAEMDAQVIPTPSHLLDRISPIFAPFFLLFCAFSPSRRDGSNEPQAGTQGQETAGTGVQTAGNTVSPG
eukprot:COSAG04_NODE_217_length_19889_cov_59.963221_9_plen_262_part_00